MESKTHLRFKYPKITLLILTYILALLLHFQLPLSSLLLKLGYLGEFLTGFLYVYAYTSGLATLILLDLAKMRAPILSAITASLGALLGDIILYYLIRKGLRDELHSLANENLVRCISGKMLLLKNSAMLLTISCLLISSPLPTELGVALMTSIRNLSGAEIILIAFILHTIGMLSILLLGSAL